MRSWHSRAPRVIAQRATEQSLDLDPEDAREVEELLLGDMHAALSSALPDDPKVASEELKDVQRLLAQLAELAGTDSKLDEFLRALDLATDDGRWVTGQVIEASGGMHL